MKEFWDIFRSNPRLIGGCIWDYKDQGLLKKDSLGNEFYAYGGDFGEKLHDGNFCINGIVASDRRPKAAMYECKWVYQPAECKLLDPAKGLIKIKNRHAVKSLGDYTPFLEILEDGKLISTKELPRINLSSGKDTIIPIHTYLPKLKTNTEYLANLKFCLANDEPWAAKGHIVSSDQFVLTGLAKPIEHAGNYPDLNITKNGTGYLVSGKNFSLVFDKTNGALSSYKWNKKEQILNPLLPHFTRPLTDNDYKGWKPQKNMKVWYDVKPQAINISYNKIGKGIVKIKTEYSLIEGKASCVVEYIVNREGVVKVDYQLMASPELPNIPKVGMQCGILRTDDQVNWYGKGPLENYIDRSYGFAAGIYSLPLDQFMEPYVMPQENGNRTDVRWMFLSDKQQNGLLLVADSLLSISAWPYTEENINKAKHTNELIDAGFITLNIDLVQMGIGGNDSWSDVGAPIEKYQVPSGNYRYAFYLFPCHQAKKDIELKAKKSELLCFVFYLIFFS